MKLQLILCCTFFQLATFYILKDMPEPLFQAHFFDQGDLRNNAFTVLQEKCNVCHSTKKKTDVFTLANMDSLAADIQKQVFIKRKMPKGRKIKLTATETQHLKIWLDDTLGDD